MKFSIFILLAFLSFFITTTSCNKGLVPTPVKIDSIKSVLPKQIIVTNTYDTSGTSFSLTGVISIKYDTTNYRIELYKDDTTNSNPYDELIGTYVYNADGYLIKSTGYRDDASFDGNISIINRGLDNKINYIIQKNTNYNQNDTTFYKYSTIGGDTKITTRLSFYDQFHQYVFSYADTLIYTPDFRLKRYINSEYGNWSYEYNANNSVNKIFFQGYNPDSITCEANFFYSSGITDSKEDKFIKVLLGKDYFVPDLIRLYPFGFSIDYDVEVNGISATNLYHISSAQYKKTQYRQPFTNEGKWTYEFNDKKLLSKVTFLNNQYSGSLRFIY